MIAPHTIDLPGEVALDGAICNALSALINDDLTAALGAAEGALDACGAAAGAADKARAERVRLRADGATVDLRGSAVFGLLDRAVPSLLGPRTGVAPSSAAASGGVRVALSSVARGLAATPVVSATSAAAASTGGGGGGGCLVDVNELIDRATGGDGTIALAFGGSEGVELLSHVVRDAASGAPLANLTVLLQGDTAAQSTWLRRASLTSAPPRHRAVVSQAAGSRPSTLYEKNSVGSRSTTAH